MWTTMVVVVLIVCLFSAWVRVLYTERERLRARIAQAEDLLYKAEYHLGRGERLRFTVWQWRKAVIDHPGEALYFSGWPKESKPFEPETEVINLQREIRWFCPERIVGTGRLPSPHPEDWLNVENWQDRPLDIV
jgi:hypothetical protein